MTYSTTLAAALYASRMTDDITQIAGADQEAVERSCADVTTGEARYLMALLDMQREAGENGPSQASLARHLNVSAPTALEMLRRLRAMGLVQDEKVRLTPVGTSAALVLSTRRRAALAIMQDVLGLEGEDAEHEAAWLAASASPVLGRHLFSWRAHGPTN
jgi:Mn-dependent DtxR family transcriptional regulator